MKHITKRLPQILCVILIAAIALCFTACGGKTNDAASAQAVILTDGETIGTGGTAFTLSITDREGAEIHAEIHTDQETVGEALKELGIIAGEDSPTGLYVKIVNGVSADYDTDGTYWAFYIDGAYAQTGVDSTVITEGASYAFQVEQA